MNHDVTCSVDGCQGAVLRIYKSDEYKVDHEICGQAAPVDNVMSDNGFIRIKLASWLFRPRPLDRLDIRARNDSLWP